jgi:hypothetical protein
MRPRLPATLLGKVDEINTALATHASELASLDAALRAAGERVAAAIAAAVQAQARENAKERVMDRELKERLDAIDADLSLSARTSGCQLLGLRLAR